MIVELPTTRQVKLTIRRWTETSADFAALMARYDAPAPALRHFGLIQWQTHRLEAAAEALLASLSLAPDNAPVWSDLAGVYDGLGDPQRAQLCIRRSIDHDPGQGQSWTVLAGLLHRAGDQDAAEAAYRTAVDLDESLADAHFGIGILSFDQRRLDDAVTSLLACIRHASDHALARTCLGHVYYTMGRFSEAAATFGAAARLVTLDRNSRLKQARCVTFQAMIEGEAEEALRNYPALLGEEAEDVETISRDAFGLLSGFGHTGAATDIGRIRLRSNPTDPIQRYLQDAVEGRSHTSAPLDYLEAYFDRFAPEFDHKLVKILQYRVPDMLASLLAGHRARFDTMVDLGCGTGLSAPHLATFGGALIGVDVSSKMLDAARQRGLYAALHKAEAVTFLKANPALFTLVFAADLLIYLGDLEPLMEAARAAIVPDGLFALSIETQADDDFTLQRSGRFAHSPAYIERLARQGFEIIEDKETVIRLEASHPVDGRLYVLRRVTPSRPAKSL